MVALPPQARRLRRGPRMASFTLRRQARRLSLAMKKTLAHFELAARVCRDAAELADKLSEEHFEEGDFAPAVTRAAKAMDDSVALVYETTLSEIDAVLKARFDASSRRSWKKRQRRLKTTLRRSATKVRRSPTTTLMTATAISTMTVPMSSSMISSTSW
jgi:hypothetical protein